MPSIRNFHLLFSDMMVSQPLPIDQKESQPRQTSDALLQVATESITTSSSYEPSSTVPSVNPPISFRTTYFYVTTKPYSTNSAASMWQQNLQHSTMASEAATMTIPVTEVALIASLSTSHTSETSSMQQSTRPLNVSLMDVPVNYASFTTAEPSARQSFLEQITTVSIKSASTSTLISDEKSNIDSEAFTHSPELQRTTIVPSRDNQRGKAVATSLLQSIDVPTKLDNKAESAKINSTAISSSRTGQTHRLPYTLRQLLQQEKRPDSRSRGNQESSGHFETFEYDSKENEIEELASQLESNEYKDDESGGQDVAEVLEQLKRKFNVWKTSKEKLPALGSIPPSERHPISEPRANVPDQVEFFFSFLLIIISLFLVTIVFSQRFL